MSYSDFTDKTKITYKYNELSYKPIGIMATTKISEILDISLFFPNDLIDQNQNREAKRPSLTAFEAHEIIDSYFKNGRTISAAAKGFNNGKGIDRKAARKRLESFHPNWKTLLDDRFEAIFYLLKGLSEYKSGNKSEKEYVEEMTPYKSILEEIISENKDLQHFKYALYKFKAFCVREQKKQKALTMSERKVYYRKYFRFYTNYFSAFHRYVRNEFKDSIGFFIKLIAVCTGNNPIFNSLALQCKESALVVHYNIPHSTGCFNFKKIIGPHQ